jgi:hypothetical protein
MSAWKWSKFVSSTLVYDREKSCTHATWLWEVKDCKKYTQHTNICRKVRARNEKERKEKRKQTSASDNVNISASLLYNNYTVFICVHVDVCCWCNDFIITFISYVDVCTFRHLRSTTIWSSKHFNWTKIYKWTSPTINMSQFKLNLAIINNKLFSLASYTFIYLRK